MRPVVVGFVDGALGLDHAADVNSVGVGANSKVVVETLKLVVEVV